MPRQARLDTPGALHHIMVRGINRSDIFDDDEDQSRFLTRLGQNILETQFSLYAWMPMEDFGDVGSKSTSGYCFNVKGDTVCGGLWGRWFKEYFRILFQRKGRYRMEKGQVSS